jgi:hypothetical protein
MLGKNPVEIGLICLASIVTRACVAERIRHGGVKLLVVTRIA